MTIATVDVPQPAPSLPDVFKSFTSVHEVPFHCSVIMVEVPLPTLSP